MTAARLRGGGHASRGCGGTLYSLGIWLLKAAGGALPG